jgi:drug/metabolite transporter (DMT)-like permease
MAAAVMLLPFSFWLWPAHSPSLRAWIAAIGLAAVCTSLAYVLFYGLLARIGSAKSMAVLYLIPVFGVLWGAMFLHETITLPMGGGCVVILLGVALTTGMLHPKAAAAADATAAVEKA